MYCAREVETFVKLKILALLSFEHKATSVEFKSSSNETAEPTGLSFMTVTNDSETSKQLSATSSTEISSLPSSSSSANTSYIVLSSGLFFIPIS